MLFFDSSMNKVIQKFNYCNKQKRLTKELTQKVGKEQYGD